MIIVWFRQDLRITDNAALSAAIALSDDILPLYVLDDDVARPIGGAQRWWLHHSLLALGNDLLRLGANLVLKHGKSEKIISELLEKYPVEAVYSHKVYEPNAIKTDCEIQDICQEKHIEFKQFSGSLLVEPNKINNKAGTAFKVYTPFYKTVYPLIGVPEIIPAPRRISQKTKFKSENLEDWGLLPKNPNWAVNFAWKPGEKSALNKLDKYVAEGIGRYQDDRDRPDFAATSQLSAHLHFGEVSPRYIWSYIKQAEIQKKSITRGAEGYLRQLVWREFSYYLLNRFPGIEVENFNKKFDKFPWEENKDQLVAWQKGQTGYPIVDAGMRQLWQTGYMHNRVRMIVASFLTKDLFIDWRLGEAWFWDTLVDADLANNVTGWQWVAGSGADAAPYFRIFNPTLQGKKFDPNGDYVRRWVPEIASLPDKYIHDPSFAPREILSEVGVKLGVTYPYLIVDHAWARDKALKIYKEIK